VEDFDETLPPVNVMVGELNQVWTNLIDNAADALGTQSNAKLIIKTRLDNGFAKISIIDNGPGIPPEIKSKIFDPFFTTKEIGKGTGLGLDVVTRIVKQHRGSISLISAPGHTEFLVCFPIKG
jgi:signal transduction histidine kinase